MGAPAHLQPIAHDAAAAEDVLRAARGLAGVLAHVAQRRNGLVDAARADWGGRHREAFDRADEDVRRALALTGELLEGLRAGLRADLDAITAENAARARARHRWEQEQARLAPPATGPAGGVPTGVLR